MSRPSLSIFFFAPLKHLLLVVALLAAFPALAAEPIVLGLNVPRSGEYREEGLMQIRGALLAVEELNNRGGVLGRPLQLIEADSASRPAQAVANVDSLVDQGARMLFGGASSAVAIAAGKRAAQRGVVYFGTLTYSNDTTGKDAHRYMFRESYNAWMASKVLGGYLQEQLPGRSYYYVTADYTWGHTTEASMRRFTATEDSRQHPASLLSFPGATQSELRAALRQAADAKPDVLVLVLFGDQMVKAMRVAHEFGLTRDSQIVVPNITLSMVEQVGPAIMEGVLAGSAWTWNLPFELGNQRGQAFVRDFAERYQSYPSTSAASAYSIVYQWAEAVTRNGTLASEALISALEDHEYQLLKDAQRWRGFDHQNVQSVYAVRIKPRAEVMRDPLRQDYFEIVSRLAGEQAVISHPEWLAERRAHGQPEQLR